MKAFHVSQRQRFLPVFSINFKNRIWLKQIIMKSYLIAKLTQYFE